MCMARYSFSSPFSGEVSHVELTDDHAAWSQAVTYVGELLKDCDGHLPHDSNWRVSVHEGERVVAEIELRARRCSDNPL
jgi:hypothetical protein